MAQADSVHSTLPTDSPIDQTRRRFLSAAAGGTALAAGAAANVTAIAATRPVLASIGADPIFAAIEAHRKAKQAADAAEAEASRLFALADETVGPYSMKVLDMREPSTPPGFTPT